MMVVTRTKRKYIVVMVILIVLVKIIKTIIISFAQVVCVVRRVGEW